jgi:hypothetical protein
MSNLLAQNLDDCHIMWGKTRTPNKSEYDKTSTGSVTTVTAKKNATVLAMDGCSIYVAPNKHREMLEAYAKDVCLSMQAYYTGLAASKVAKVKTNVSKPRPKSIHDLLQYKYRCQTFQDWSDDQFLHYALQVIPRLPRFYLVEINGHQWTDILRVWFELDIKSLNEANLLQLEADFAKPEGFVQTLIRHLIQFLRQCYPDHGENMHISIIGLKRVGGLGQKVVGSGPNSDKMTTIYTSGIHLHAPELFVTIKDLLNIRNNLVQYLDQAMPLQPYELYNAMDSQEPVQWSHLIDASPINPNKGLRLPGSFKCEKCPECQNKSLKRATCCVCDMMGYLHIDKFYWPHTWTYEHLQSDKKFINATEFQVSPDKSGFEIQLMDTGEHDLRVRNMIYLTSIKTNGACVACGEEGHEKPFEYRMTPTAGLNIKSTVSGLNKRKRKVSKSDDDTMDPTLDTKKGQVGFVFEARRGSDDLFLDRIQASLAECVNPWTTSHMTVHPTKSSSSQHLTQSSHWDQLASTLTYQTKVKDGIRRWKDIEIQRVQSFMVRVTDSVRTEILKVVPLGLHETELLDKVKTLPYFLYIYLNPVKNEASRKCPFKSNTDPMHSKNNIFFQVILPVINQDIKTLDATGKHPVECQLGAMADWAARWLNMMRHKPEDLKVQDWFIRVRCFSDKCKTQHTDYAISWGHLLTLVEPVLQRMLIEAHYQFDTKRQEYNKP